MLIRRLLDELVTTNDSGTDDERRASNRANALLKELLETRYPGLLNGFEYYVEKWLSSDQVERVNLLPSDYLVPHSRNYKEMTKNQRIDLIYYYCSKYFIDFDSTHNTPLNPNLFIIPSPV